MAQRKRYFQNDGQPVQRVNAYDELLASLTRINLYNPPVQTCSTEWTFHGLYAGPTSIAYLFLRLSLLYPDLVFKGQSLLDWAQAYLELGASFASSKPHVDPSHCGIANERLAQLAVRAVVDKDPSLIQELCAYAPVINTTSDAGSDEWLYGRAGYLYFLRLARTALPTNNDQTPSSMRRLLNSTVEATVDRIIASPKPWTWHCKAYLGAAHGSIGIVAQVVLAQPERASELQDLLSQLLDKQFPNGNFPSSMPPSSNKLVQFCHGAPGFVLSLQSLKPHFHQNSSLTAKIDKAIDLARDDIWTRGLLTKTPCLCHGIAGNVLALDAQEQFDHFLAHMSTDVLEDRGWLKNAGQTDEFAGLYVGEGGRAWVWAVADRHLDRTCIGFNDL